jgi:MerR family transcriptional regulator, light-induced transcriptional regulator
MEHDAVRPDVPEGSEPHLSVAAVARMLGIAPATLRTWDRRYGIGPSAHAPGHHRRYSPQDVARLELMQHALVRGAGPADAARYAMAGPLRREPATPRLVDTGRARAGGQTLRLPGADPYARGLGRAALALDFPAARSVLVEAIGALGVPAAWDEVARPVLAAVAKRWAVTGAGIEVEHLLSQSVTAAFSAHAGERFTREANRPGGRPVLLAGMPHEQHVLPLIVLGAALADEGVTTRPLGSDLPVDALVSAVRRTTPAVVVLWSQLPPTADVTVLDALPSTRPRVRTFVAGPGWGEIALPRQVQLLESLMGAVDAVVAAATG